jgi:AcrR family transcriptional regulator
MRAFARWGYDGTSLSALVDETGINKPSLYAAFGNKEQLFLRAFDQHEREDLAFMTKALDAPTARGVADAMLRGILLLRSREPGVGICMGLIGFLGCSVEASTVGAKVQERLDRRYSALVARFKQAERGGDVLGTFEADGLARYLLAMMQGLAIQKAAGEAEAAAKSIVDTTLSMWPTR